jgi:uncharacterized membrane protein
MGGVFFAFSSFVMKALATLPAPQGIAAMQSINIAAITPLFIAALFGTAAICALLIIYALPLWRRPGVSYLLLGGLLYLVGVMLTTIVFNVPLNNLLERVEPVSPDGARIWAAYLSSWTAWNHVRAVSAILAAAAFTIALGRLRSAN